MGEARASARSREKRRGNIMMREKLGGYEMVKGDGSGKFTPLDGDVYVPSLPLGSGRGYFRDVPVPPPPPPCPICTFVRITRVE